MERVTVAAVQAAPVFLDREATVDKAVGLIAKSAGNGAGRVVFPETFVPTYPDWVWRTKPWADVYLYARLFAVFDTPFGRLGGLTCWENYMPLARAALYSMGIDIYLAPTWDNSGVWVSTLRHIAKEGRVYVVGVNFCIRGSDVPDDVPGRAELYGGDDDWLSRGNTTIVAPDGEILAGPLVEKEGILYAELDAGTARAARQHFDPAGHYSRPDVFHLSVDRRSKRWVGPAESRGDPGGGAFPA